MATVTTNITETKVETTVEGDSITVNIITPGAAGVSSFNGRTGPVVPATGDYAMTQVSDTSSALTAWTGAVSESLLAGGHYTVNVTGTVTSLAITLGAEGEAKIYITNGSAFAIAEPTTGYKRTSTGLDDIAEAYVEMLVTRTGSSYAYSAVSLEALP